MNIYTRKISSSEIQKGFTTRTDDVKIAQYWAEMGYVVTPDPTIDGISLAVSDLVRACHGAASDAGWWKPGDTDNPLMFSNKLCLIHSEVSESMEGDRKGCMDDKLPHRPMREVELADALIRICDLAGAYGMDLGGAVVEKMAFNKTRADHTAAARAANGGKAY